jgi:2-polyprenyl-6-methoxyphenol hydroxylase-like FAD-dependent oxidoreductase
MEAATMSHDPQTRKRIVILGGGTAGWITASAMIDSWADKDIDITLIESPAIGTIGVGEGSTPRIKLFFDSIGVQESEWMPKCNATYKNGISFANWSTRPGFDRYFHPFVSTVDQHTTTAFYFNTYARRRGIDVHAHPDRFFLAAKLSANRQGPIPNETFPFVVEYGYHFDANLVGEFLKEKAKERGVKHIAAKVIDVKQASNGHITGLLTDADETIEGDFFVDCSGFRGTLIQKTLEVPFWSFSENLFNDSAVVLPTDPEVNIGSQTVSTAMKHGWAWEIPLTHRVGNGYVYSSSFCSSDDAETELRTHLGLLDSDTEARHLKMKVGRVEEHWHKNCIAVGLSQGFIEPLEATALNLVCNTVYDFIETVDAKGFAGPGREEFNERVNERFENIRDYIVAHYIMNSRDDTDYWRQNGDNKHVSETLQQILQIWTTGKSLSQEMERLEISSSYTAMSWHCLLAGYGFYPDIKPTSVDRAVASKIDMHEIDEFIRRCSLNFRPQIQQLNFE